jgi:rod shape-determining protein MreC
MALTTPESEPRLFYGPGPGLRLLLIAGACIALMVLDHRDQHLKEIRRYLGAAVHPLQQLADAPFAAGRWVSENFATRTELIAQNRKLSRNLLIQNASLQRMATLEAENTRLRALLESTEKVGDQVLVAEILSVDMDPLRHRIVINKGSKSGAFVGQALIDASGVVGQIVRDQLKSSEALLITDPDHAIPVEVVRNSLRTIAVGSGDLDSLSLPYLARNADVRKGDLLVSSGLGGSFPWGYPVATVTEVRGDTGEAFLRVRARPTAALDRIREVLLVVPRPEAPASDSETPAEPEKPAGKSMRGATKPAAPAAVHQDATPSPKPLTPETPAPAAEPVE